MQRLSVSQLQRVASLAVMLAATGYAHAAQYTIVLKNGDNPDCNIATYDSSRTVLENEYRAVSLGDFAENNGTYTYTWQTNFADTVAIQVDLAKGHMPDVWGDQGCVYAPRFDATIGRVTFTQQYIDTDGTYTCSCTSSWDEG